MKVVLFKNQDSSLSVLTPTQEALRFATIEQIAMKDIPAGRPYWIVDVNSLPADIPIEAITIDEREYLPHGYGGDSNEFPPEIVRKFKEIYHVK